MIPDKIVFVNDELQIKRESVLGAFGYIIPKDMTICIEKDIDEIQAHIILMHELIHYLEEIGIEGGAFKKRFTEPQVAHLASGLTFLLSLNPEIICKSTKEEIKRFLEGK